MAGAELATTVSGKTPRAWKAGPWEWGEARAPVNASSGAGEIAGGATIGTDGPRIVALDYGIKGNILRLLAGRGARVTVMPADASMADVMALDPDGLFLSNGPGDPAATGTLVGTTIANLIDRGLPTFGICLGHQLVAHAIGAKTVKMRQGHHGANHPVIDLDTGRVSIVSMNHGFAVDATTLPPTARETHRSLFDGSNCGLALTDKPAFSVQYHPEASPGPHDSHRLFDRFLAMIAQDEAALQR